MILKIGKKDGFKYIEAKNDVEIKSFNPMDVIYNILHENDTETATYESDAEEIKTLIDKLTNDWILKNPDKDKNLFNAKLSVNGKITELANAGIVSDIGIDEMIDDILKGYGYHSNIIVIEFTNNEFNGSRQAIVMYNYNNSYLLNDDGKTIDIIK